MRFVLAPSEIAAAEITEAINNFLQEGPVLLLVSGGSNILLAVNVCNKLDKVNQLTLGLIDERFGPPGHPDSNWAQLIEYGLNTEDINLLPVIEIGQTIEVASKNYSKRLQTAIDMNPTTVAIFGIGTDGHTAGLLPGSPALKSLDIVAYYNGPDFPRITTTPVFMRMVHKGFLVSYGGPKHPQLARLHEDVPVSEQPAQILKQIKDLTVYSDYGIGSRR